MQMNKQAKKVALYARTSMADQNLDTQLMALKDYCARMDYQIMGKYVDSGFSGKDDKRPEFERLLSDIRANSVNCVIVYKLDRIGRSLKHLLNLFDEFKNRGVEFISFTQNINTNTPEGKMFWQMLGVFAEYERELIVARTLSGLQRAIKQGKRLGRPAGAKDKKRRRLSGYIARWNGSK
jgi:DNA invertase Pin-like site-specific DNA recombinase